jgi:hypothetical protein
LAERTGVEDLRGMISGPRAPEGRGVPTAKLAITLRDAAWWDGVARPFPAAARQDAYLPDSSVIRLTGQTAAGRPVALATKAGHNDGHHSHADVGTFILHVDGESLLCDPGRGRYSKEYFRLPRYENVFCNSFGHSVPRIACPAFPGIGGQLQSPGPEFGGRQQYHGTVIACETGPDEKSAVIDFHRAYDIPSLSLARRTLRLDPKKGNVLLEDAFAFDGAALEIEEAFVTWLPVDAEGASARVVGKRSILTLSIQEPAGATFTAASLAEECRINERDDILTRLAVALPRGATRFRLRMEIDSK